MNDLTHIDALGRARMVDVGEKPVTQRSARAEASVRMAAATLAAIRDQSLPKGDVVAAARMAGIMAAKRTAELIPLCHHVALTSVTIEMTADAVLPGIRIVAEARAADRTGVEMEALVAAAAAALTVYDMCKAIDRGMEITTVRLLEKLGGRSGEWIRSGERPAPTREDEGL